MFLKGLFLIAICIVVPFLVGQVYVGRIEDENRGVSVSLVSGYVISWAIFELIVLPSTWLRMSLTFVTKIYAGVMLLIAVIELIKNRKYLLALLGRTGKRCWRSSWVLKVAMIVIVLQAVYVSYYQHIDDDDAFYVGTAETAVTTDSVMKYDPYTGEAYQEFPARYVLSPFPIFVAFISKLIEIKPIIVAHTILPTILIPLVYMVYYMLARLFYKEDSEKIGYFILILCFALAYANYTQYTQGSFMFLRIWQGKAVLTAILLPVIYYFFFQYLDTDKSWRTIFMLLCVMGACCMVSSMGIMLGAIELGILGIACLIESRSVSRVLPLALCVLPNVICAAIYILIR